MRRSKWKAFSGGPLGPSFLYPPPAGAPRAVGRCLAPPARRQPPRAGSTRAPFAPDWTADTLRLGVTYLVVDRYWVATSNGDTMGGEAAAREYFTGLALIGLPTLTIAHVRGDSGKFPDRPFGSVFVHNLARETWAVERLGDDEPDTDQGDPNRRPTGRTSSRSSFATRSQRPAQVPGQFVTFSFYADGRSARRRTARRPRGRTLPPTRWPTVRMTLPRQIRGDQGGHRPGVTEDTLGRTRRRHPQRFAQSPRGRPRTWYPDDDEPDNGRP